MGSLSAETLRKERVRAFLIGLAALLGGLYLTWVGWGIAHELANLLYFPAAVLGLVGVILLLTALRNLFHDSQYEITIEDDQLILRTGVGEPHRVARAEVTRILQSRAGFTVQGATARNAISVSRKLEDYDDLRAEVATWGFPMREISAIPRPLVEGLLVHLLAYALLFGMLAFAVWRPWLGLPLLGIVALLGILAKAQDVYRWLRRLATRDRS